MSKIKEFEKISSEKEKIEILLIYCENLEERIDSLTSRILKLESFHVVNQSITRKEIISMSGMSERTFDRKLKSGDINQVMNGRYAVSRALYDDIRANKYRPDGYVAKTIQELAMEYSDYIPSYVFTTP